MKFGVLVFPGSNCDHDTQNVIENLAGQPVAMLWHDSPSLEACDAILVPGGFAYGDYLRTGAIAARAPVMRAVADKAAAGVAVLGVCNGFQILCEAGLLPGILMRNASLHFVCREIRLRVETTASVFTSRYASRQVIRCPIAHGEGNYRCDDVTLARLKNDDRIVFRYVDDDGRTTDAANPNGSLDAIAGILNEGRNVLGLMPHPENMIEPLQGGSDGRGLFESVFSSLKVAA